MYFSMCTYYLKAEVRIFGWHMMVANNNNHARCFFFCIPAVFKVIDTTVASMKPSYDELWQQVEAQKRLAMKLTWDLQAEQALRKNNTSAPHPKIT